MRGLLFTVSLFLVAASILALGIVLFENNIETNFATNRFVLYDTIDEEIKYVENSYRDIFSKFVSIRINGSNITIVGPLPNNASIFKAINNFIRLAKNNTIFVLELSNDTKQMRINEINYTYDKGFDNNRVVITNANNVFSYTVTLLISQNGTINVSWTTSPGTNPFLLTVRTNNNLYSASELLDFSDSTEVNILIGASLIELEVGKNTDKGRLKIENVDNLPLNISTTMRINATQLRVTMHDESINISSDEFNITKRGNVRVI